MLKAQREKSGNQTLPDSVNGRLMDSSIFNPLVSIRMFPLHDCASHHAIAVLSDDKC